MWFTGLHGFLVQGCSKVQDSEHKYRVFDRELLVLHLATCLYHFLLEGHSITIHVNHKPLPFGMSKVTELCSAHQQCHLASISEFTMVIWHVAGKSDPVCLLWMSLTLDQHVLALG